MKVCKICGKKVPNRYKKAHSKLHPIGPLLVEKEIKYVKEPTVWKKLWRILELNIGEQRV